MTNETIGHYGFHPGGGYQPPETNKKKCQFPPESSGLIITHNVKTFDELTELLGNVSDNGSHNITTTIPIVTELELKIRKEVMDAVDEILTFEEKDEEYFYGLVRTIKDRLSLLWGDK